MKNIGSIKHHKCFLNFPHILHGMRKIYFLMAVAGIVSLYFVSFLYQPDRVTLSEIWKYSGKDVVVEGRVKNVAGNLITISDGNCTAFIYWENGGEVEYGDYVEAVGRVGEYGENFAIYAREVKIIRKWDENVISLPYLAENYEKFLNENVNVSGYIYSKYTGYFYLTDEYMEYRIRVYCNQSIPFKKYERVVVKALMLYDPGNLSFYLKVCDDSHGVMKYD